MITIFNKRRKKAENELLMAKNEIKTLREEMLYLQNSYKSLMTESQNMVKELQIDNQTHYINNLPKYPQEVIIEFHIGVKKQVYFDGNNFLKQDGSTYRLGSIKLWKEL